jgi:hypothetical protein
MLTVIIVAVVLVQIPATCLIALASVSCTLTQQNAPKHPAN